MGHPRVELYISQVQEPQPECLSLSLSFYVTIMMPRFFHSPQVIELRPRIYGPRVSSMTHTHAPMILFFLDNGQVYFSWDEFSHGGTFLDSIGFFNFILL